MSFINLVKNKVTNKLSCVCVCVCVCVCNIWKQDLAFNDPRVEMP